MPNCQYLEPMSQRKPISKKNYETIIQHTNRTIDDGSPSKNKYNHPTKSHKHRNKYKHRQKMNTTKSKQPK